ncbi:lactonase family protein [Cohnella caldifontis]|uniref:lactonase family protein n=1 Tax=Cohnella caldifontis TaxID=3027471 RepID=UPI0023EB37AB|nr:lactonase family protein [Cohnella sp. YIM B05605]
MENRDWELWVGAYASADQAGITRLTLNGATGEITKTNEYGGIENPSFLALNRAGNVLYAVSETMEVEGQPGGRMIAYPVDPQTRKLSDGWERLTHGAAPCHVSLDPDERWLAVANYFGAAVTLYPLEPGGKPGDAMVRLRHAGSGPHKARQEMPHPHSAVFHPKDGKFLYVPDLGLDRVMIYGKGEDGVDWSSAGAAALAPEDGPRHLAFHPDGQTMFVVNELSGSVTRFVLGGEPGKPERRETVTTLPPSFRGENTCAEIAVSPDGRFVYASNRGHDSIAVFRLDEEGALSPAGHVSTRGRTPRHFAVTPDGSWLIAANQDSDSLVLFRIEPESGLPIFHGVQANIGKPVCVRINPGPR